MFSFVVVILGPAVTDGTFQRFAIHYGHGHVLNLFTWGKSKQSPQMESRRITLESSNQTLIYLSCLHVEVWGVASIIWFHCFMF